MNLFQDITEEKIVDNKIFFKNSQGENICGLLAIPNGEGPFPAVVGLHGFRTNKNGTKMTELSKRLPEIGVAFLRMDFSGLGESEGNFIDTTIGKNVDECHSAFEYLKTRKDIDKERFGLFGSSMGGMVSIVEAARNSEIKKLLLSAPVTNFDWAERQYTVKELEEYEKRGWSYTISTSYNYKLKICWEFIREGRTYDLMELAKKIHSKTRIVHGVADTSLKIENSRKFIQNVESGDIIEIEGCNHHFKRPEEFKKLIDSTVDFFSKL